MKKKILLLAMLPAYPALAQTHVPHEDLHRKPVVSALTTEIRNTELSLANIGNKPSDMPLRVSTAEEQKQLKESFDYFPAEDALHNRIDHPGVAHDVSSTHFGQVSLNLEGIVYDKLDCFVIHDRYSMKAGKELPGDYKYNNTYFLYLDKSGATIATVIYVESAIGSFKAQNRIVKKGLAVLSDDILTIAPNPAHNNITLRYRIAVAGQYSLYISTIEGKTVTTLLDKKMLAPGTQTLSAALNLAPGMYMVMLGSDRNAPVIQKLIIQ